MSHSVLLIGLGAIGMGYDAGHPQSSHVATHARAFKLHEAFGPVAGVDPDAARRSAFDAQYGGPSYPTELEALARHKPSVVVIATPTVTHAQTLRRVLDHSAPLAILCEKPLAYELADAQAMVEACEQRGVALYVNYMRRCDPAVAAFKQMIGRGETGAPLKGVVWYSKGLIHNGSHFVDLLGHWLGPVREVALIRAGRRWEGRDPEPDFVFEYAQGAVQFLAAREESFSHYTVELIAPHGRLRYERGGEQVQWQRIVDDADFAGYRVLDPTPAPLPADMGRSQLNVTNQLAQALASRTVDLCTGRAALQTLRDIHRVIELL